jgi:hypothetical protein
VDAGKLATPLDDPEARVIVYGLAHVAGDRSAGPFASHVD